MARTGISRPLAITFVALCLTLGLSASLLNSSGSAQQGERIVTLGADLTTAQQNEVLGLLGATRQDRILEVTTAETIQGSRGIIEVAPGTPSISSTSITCREEGSGIQVRTRNIEAVTAGMYAQALLTAGITDANLVVAAPADAAAEGLTALTGIFKSYRLSPCTERLDPQREQLAQRELAITADLGEALGDQETAANIVLSTQEQVVSRKLRNRLQVQQVVNSQLQGQGGDVPAALRNRLTDLMVRLGAPGVDWGGYAQGWQLQRIDANQVSISARPAQAATGVATGAPQATGTGAAGNTLEGTVQNIGADGVTVATTGGGTETVPVGDDVEVVRDGQPATLADLQATDRVTVERDASGRATRIVATSASPTGVATAATAAPTGAAAEATGTAPTGAATESTAEPAGAPGDATAIVPDAATPQAGEAASPTEPVIGASGGIISGTVSGRENNTLSVRTGGGGTRNVPLTNTEGLEVTRNGSEATVDDIQQGDEVSVTLGANGAPRRIIATSTPAEEDNGFNWLWCLPGLLLLLPLLLLLRRRRPTPAGGRNPFVVTGRRRRRETQVTRVREEPRQTGTTDVVIRPTDRDPDGDGSRRS